MNSYLAGDRGIILLQVKRKIHPTVSVAGVGWGRRGKTSTEGVCVCESEQLGSDLLKGEGLLGEQRGRTAASLPRGQEEGEKVLGALGTCVVLAEPLCYLAGNNGGKGRRFWRMKLSSHPQQQADMSGFRRCSIMPWWRHSTWEAFWMLLSADDTSRANSDNRQFIEPWLDPGPAQVSLNHLFCSTSISCESL